MSSWNALRALARVELRQLAWHRGRSLLVVLLIAVPVAAMVGGSALLFVTRQTIEEQRVEAMGQATLRMRPGGGWTMERALESLPEHARTTTVVRGTVEVISAGRRLRARDFRLEPHALEPGELAAGLLVMNAGRAPGKAGEVALSEVLIQGLGVTLGESVAIDGRTVLVTGRVADPENLNSAVVLRPYDGEGPVGRPSILVELPEAEAASIAAQWEAQGAQVDLRSRTGADDPFEAFLIFVLGSFAFFEAALVVAAAFAVGMRRRQRELGLLGSNGAPRSGMVAALLVSAAALAAVGGALGIAVGAACARALHPYLDGWTGRMNGPFVAGAFVLGIVTAVLAATLPACGAVRLPIRVALSGRRPVAGSSRGWLFAGLGLGALGVLLVLAGAFGGTRMAALLILSGSILLALGLGAASPWILGGLASWAGPLPIAWRLAVRDAGRFRARNGPAVTAVMAGLSVSVMMAALIASVKDLTRVLDPFLRDDVILVEGPAAEAVARELEREFTVLAAAPFQAVYCDGSLVRAHFADAIRDGERVPFDAWIACGGEELLEVFGVEAAVRDFRAGQIVTVTAERAGASVSLFGSGSDAIGVVPVSGSVATQRLREPRALLSLDHLDALGLHAGLPPRNSLLPWLVRLDRPVTEAMAERARGLAAAAGSPGNTIDAEALRMEPITGFYTLVLALCIVTGLIVIFVATALSSVESTEDAAILHTVGAAPALLRAHAATRAGYLAFLGSALAIPAGLMPMIGFQRLAALSLDFVMPWREIAITLLVMPLVAYAGTWLVATWRKAPRRASISLS